MRRVQLRTIWLNIFTGHHQGSNCLNIADGYDLLFSYYLFSLGMTCELGWKKVDKDLVGSKEPILFCDKKTLLAYLQEEEFRMN